MKLPKYLQSESIKKKANKAEKKIFKHLQSGAIDFFKGDFSTNNCIIEYKKLLKRKQFTLSEKILNKLNEECLEMGKENAFLLIEFKNFFVICKVIKKGGK